MGQKFSIDEAIGYGWKTMKANIGFFIVILLIVTVVQIVPSIVVELIKTKMPVLTFVISLLSALVNMVMGIGLIRIALRLHDTQVAEVGDLFSCDPLLFFRYLAGIILFTLILAGVMVLLFAPVLLVISLGGKSHPVILGATIGLAFIAGALLLTWLTLKLQFYGYLIIDRSARPFASLARSSTMTRGVKGQLLILWFLLGLINLAGVLACFVGLFATIPISMMATAFVYRKLLEERAHVTGA